MKEKPRTTPMILEPCPDSITDPMWGT